MKKINEFILESFKINSKTLYKPIDSLAKLFNLDKEEAEYLYEYFDKENTLINFKNPACSPLEALLILAFMLVDDDMDFRYFDYLGYKAYKRLGGKHNPYDYSWFEEEDDPDNHQDYLHAVMDWIIDNENEFKKIYDIVKKHKNDFTEDKIYYDLQEILN